MDHCYLQMVVVSEVMRLFSKSQYLLIASSPPSREVSAGAQGRNLQVGTDRGHGGELLTGLLLVAFLHTPEQPA